MLSLESESDIVQPTQTPGKKAQIPTAQPWQERLVSFGSSIPKAYLTQCTRGVGSSDKVYT